MSNKTDKTRLKRHSSNLEDLVEDLQGQKKALQGSLQEYAAELVETKRNADEAYEMLNTTLQRKIKELEMEAEDMAAENRRLEAENTRLLRAAGKLK